MTPQQLAHVTQQQSPLFSTYGMSSSSYDNEGRTVDALLWVLRHEPALLHLLSSGKMSYPVTTHARPRLRVGSQTPTPDAIIVPRPTNEPTGISALMAEAKIGTNKIDLDQCRGYQEACAEYGIPNLVTISNEPNVVLPPHDAVQHLHLPWSHIIAEVDWTIELRRGDPSNELMEEFLRYASSDKVGINSEPLPTWAITWHQARSTDDPREVNSLLSAVQQLRNLT